jgi:glycerol-3-phosphate O-acyltransferase / dihydroxyacetone phosphate acyltransferase
MPAASWLVRGLTRLTCHLFYRVDRVGSPPPEGAVLLLPNHANALLDPAIIWATAGRDVRFLAKSTLFDGPLRPLLAGAGAIPVYRKLDQGVDVSKNSETFVAVKAALAAGDAICIFPEGISHSSGRLVPLRTGAARMALSAAEAGIEVALVAVGLNFERKTAFRSRVTVLYGPPFSCAGLTPQRDDDSSAQSNTENEAHSAEANTIGERTARHPGASDRQRPDSPDSAPASSLVRALTERIAGHMRRLLIEADPKADAALVDRVDRLYAGARGYGRDPLERIGRRRVIAAGMSRLREADPDRYEEILLRLRRYDQRLARFGFRDRHLDIEVTRAQAIRFAARESVAAIALVPLAAAAILMFAVPYHLTGRAARLATRDADVAATAKVFTGLPIHAVWLALLASVAWSVAGMRAALLVLAVLPIVAVAGLFAMERESAVLDGVRAWWQLRRTGAETQRRLRRRRSELADVLDEVNEWLGREG